MTQEGKTYCFNQLETTFNREKLNEFPLNLRGCRVESDFAGLAGNEHYRVLSYLSTLVTGTIIDIGSNHGYSALALSHNEKNQIFSFDIEDKVNEDIKRLESINFVIANICDGDNEDRKMWLNTILNSALIFLDIDPHEGAREYEFYQFLKKNKYQGIVVVDDIWMFKGMRDNFWSKIPTYEKFDISEFGHFSGTGVITFNNSISSSERFFIDDYPSFLEMARNSWTFVTAYFNLAKCPDASPSILERDFSYYFQHANGTLGLPVNLLIFCDKDSYPFLESLRPSHLNGRTKYIICDFEDFPLTKYREKIISNRIEKPYRFDDRNTASYYLFCMARYAMMKQAILEDHFNSSHFAWINICMERMGYQNLMNIDNVMTTKRDKFSTCYIDFIPKSLIDDLPNYFAWGRCSMCSGFFTGNAYYMKKFCDKIEKQFMKYLNLGYGHADEQLYSPVYFSNPELFEFYFGDYTSMITNYDKIRVHFSEIVRHFIGNSFRSKEFKLCATAFNQIQQSLNERGDEKLLGCERENFYTFGMGLCAISKDGQSSLAFLLKRELAKLGI